MFLEEKEIHTLAIFIVKKQGLVLRPFGHSSNSLLKWKSGILWTQLFISHTVLTTMLGAVIKGWINECS